MRERMQELERQLLKKESKPSGPDAVVASELPAKVLPDAGTAPSKVCRLKIIIIDSEVFRSTAIKCERLHLLLCQKRSGAKIICKVKAKVTRRLIHCVLTAVKAGG